MGWMEFARDMKPGAPKPLFRGGALADGTAGTPRMDASPFADRPAACASDLSHDAMLSHLLFVCARVGPLWSAGFAPSRGFRPARVLYVRVRWSGGSVLLIVCVCVCDARLGAYCVWYRASGREHRKGRRARALELTCNLNPRATLKLKAQPGRALPLP